MQAPIQALSLYLSFSKHFRECDYFEISTSLSDYVYVSQQQPQRDSTITEAAYS